MSAGLTSRRITRASYIALAALTIALGLAVHLAAAGLHPVTRDVLGDALWAVMILWWVSAAAPNVRLGARSAVALGICVVVELSQLIHSPTIDAVRRTTLGHLFLGSGFDPRDLAAYALGVVAAGLLDWATFGR